MMNFDIIAYPFQRIKHFIVFHINKFQKFSTLDFFRSEPPFSYDNFTELPLSFV